MKTKKAAGVLFALLTGVGLSGCAQYIVAGQFEDTGVPFYGRVMVSVTDSGTLDVQTEDGRIQCSGASWVTERGSLLSNIGAQGAAEATCNDGRSFKVDFVQTSESGGHGQGIDDRGNIVQVYFDMSDSAARARLERARLDTLVR